MEHWLTIEVRDGAAHSADRWRRTHAEALLEAAVTNGAGTWEWHEPRWGVVLEIGFRDEAARNAFRDLPALLAALDAVPDPLSGLFVYPGRGGTWGAGVPARPRPAPAAGAVHADAPRDRFLDVSGAGR